MACLRCGKNTEPWAVFCESCLKTMGEYPVKSDVVIQLPHRQEEPKRPAPRRRVFSDQQRMKRLTVSNRVLVRCLIVALLLIALLIVNTRFLLNELEEARNMGKNYSTVDPSWSEAATQNPNAR